MSNRPPSIDQDKLLDWVSEKFSDYKERQNGEKILVNSPWADDQKFHCALFPSRGETGRFRDFKSGKSGDLYAFYMEVEECGFKKAVETIGSSSGQGTTKRKTLKKHEPIKSLENKMKWPKGLKRISENSDIPEVRKAAVYMQKRGLDPEKVHFYYCTRNHKTGRPEKPYTQRLKGRILIPFYGPEGNPIYWSARAINGDDPKYYEPDPHDKPASKEAVMYCADWEQVRGRRIVVCEGAIDAISLWMADIPAVSTQGAQYYASQDSILKKLGAKPVFGFDRDEAGKMATIAAAATYGKDDAFFIFPPEDEENPENKKGHDWNSLLVSKGKEWVHDYILRNAKHLDERASFVLRQALS